MSKIKIELITLGYTPENIDFKKLIRLRSSLFEFTGQVNNHKLYSDSNGTHDWSFEDVNLREVIPQPSTGTDFLLAVTNVPLQDNWYSRRIGNNIIVLTFHEIKDILNHYNIPLENIIKRVCYAYSLVYLSADRRIPDYNEGVKTNFTHDETRGCLFDMNGIKTDIIESCDSPQICGYCQERLFSRRVPENKVKTICKEILKIRKPLYYRMHTHIKKHPIIALILTSLLAILLGIIGSTLASIIYDNFIKTSAL
ncbi:hypothetical protein [Pantoea dispersa]|uniref:hypothetical protein n=1 Tax=Pantoea dispersa TaxID=59814 RepID=UPI0039BEBB3C